MVAASGWALSESFLPSLATERRAVLHSTEANLGAGECQQQNLARLQHIRSENYHLTKALTENMVKY